MILRRPRRIVDSTPHWLRARPNLSRRLFVFFMLFVLLLAAGRGMAPYAARLSGDLPIGAPLIASTGDEISVEIGPVNAGDGTPVGLVMVGTHGPRVYNTTFEAGMAQFVIPPADTLQPGYLALIVAADDARGEASILLYARNNRATLAAVAPLASPIM